MPQPSPFEALKLAVEAVNTQSAFARLCGVGQPAVWKWLQSGKRLPAEHVLTVERVTGISRHWLRPDIYPFALPDGTPCVDVEPVLSARTTTIACDRRASSQWRHRA